MSAEGQVRLNRLLEWAKSRNIWWNENMEVRSIDAGRSGDSKGSQGAGFGVFASGSAALPEVGIDVRQVVVLVPKSTIFSARTASIAPFLPSDILFTASSTAGLLLALVLLHEYLLGTQGPWWGYLQSLPHGLVFPPGHENSRAPAGRSDAWGVPIPLLWSHQSQEWRWIVGTEAGRMVTRSASDPTGKIEGLGMSLQRIHDYFQTTALPILRKSQPLLFEKRSDDARLIAQLQAEYERAYSIISSRAFVVDMFHGLALVPLADMFNHTDSPNMHFETDDEVCDECGALGSCPHTDDPLPNTAYGRPSAFIPAAHGPNSLDWQPPSGLVGVDTVDMVAQAPIMRGTEAWNSYGLMSNATLLTTYGFTLSEETEWERISWEWRNTEERGLLLQAFELTDIQLQEPIQDAESRKRRLSCSEAQEPLVKRRLGEAAHPPRVTLQFWARLCASYAGVPLEAFAEILTVNSAIHPKPATAPFLTLPVALPLSTLARVEAAQADHKSDEASDSNTDAEQTLPAGLSTLLAPISHHDGSADERQPLFIDGDGRISIVLWRAVLLAVMARSTSAQAPDDAEQQELRSKVTRVEVLLASAVANLERVETSQLQGSSADSVLLDRALEMVQGLSSARMEALRIAREGEEEAALRIIESKEAGPLLSAVQHAFQELAALRTCIDHIAAIRSNVNDQ